MTDEAAQLTCRPTPISWVRCEASDNFHWVRSLAYMCVFLTSNSRNTDISKDISLDISIHAAHGVVCQDYSYL